MKLLAAVMKPARVQVMADLRRAAPLHAVPAGSRDLPCRYRKRHKHIDSEVLKHWAWQILCGLVYLHGHEPSIIHR